MDYTEGITASVAQHIENLDHLECDYLNLPEEMRDEDIIDEYERILKTLENFKPQVILTIDYNDSLNVFNWSFE